MVYTKNKRRSQVRSWPRLRPTFKKFPKLIMAFLGFITFIVKLFPLKISATILNRLFLKEEEFVSNFSSCVFAGHFGHFGNSRRKLFPDNFNNEDKKA